ncbi:uncharacterized protein LOC125370504 [Ricinus communis]|uniref:uncharacterized protein LOC125370504 n=1 Tax=Ricinus communis TaxID=3988 RepID=UPI00201A5B7A|nr:uncharacterized protein LOC125370504 [Ricinus communis]
MQSVPNRPSTSSAEVFSRFGKKDGWTRFLDLMQFAFEVTEREKEKQKEGGQSAWKGSIISKRGAWACLYINVGSDEAVTNNNGASRKGREGPPHFSMQKQSGHMLIQMSVNDTAFLQCLHGLSIVPYVPEWTRVYK